MIDNINWRTVTRKIRIARERKNVGTERPVS